MKTFQLDIQTAESKLFSGPVESLVAKAADGEIGILPDHARLATRLVPGRLRLRQADGSKKLIKNEAGFLIVRNNHASVLMI